MQEILLAPLLAADVSRLLTDALHTAPGRAADKAFLKLTLIEATPAFHSLPVFALKQNAKDYNLDPKKPLLTATVEAKTNNLPTFELK